MASPISIGSASPVSSLYREDKNVKHDEPEFDDEYNLVYMTMFYQGLSSHFPWNVLLAGQGYFKSRLAGLELARDFLSHFTIIFMVVKYSFLLGALFMLRKYNPKWQVFSSTIGDSVTFLLLTVVCCTPTISQTSFYISSLILVLCGSLFSALWEAGLLAIIGQLPVKFTQAYMAGCGVAGVVVITISIASYFIAGTFQSEAFAKIYFGISFALILAGFFSFWAIQRNKFYQHYKKIVEEVAIRRHKEVSEDLAKLKDCASFTEIFTEVREIAIGAFISATIGFIIFPEFMFHTKSTLCGTAKETWFHRDMFINAALFLANIFDLFGKLLPLVPVFSFKTGPFILVSLLRIITIPFYLLGNVKIPGYILPFTPKFASDTLFFIIVSLSSFTSSYLATVSLMWAPARVKPHERTVAIAIIIICGAVGFITGTSISMVSKHMILHYSTKIDQA